MKKYGETMHFITSKHKDNKVLQESFNHSKFPKKCVFLMVPNDFLELDLYSIMKDSDDAINRTSSAIHVIDSGSDLILQNRVRVVLWIETPMVSPVRKREKRRREEKRAEEELITRIVLMAWEIEKYLLDKLDRAIEDTKSTEHYLSTVMFDVQSDFKKLKELLQPNARTTPAQAAQRREHLYYLNNLLSEWQLLSKSQSIYSPEGLNSAYTLSKRLKKIKKYLRGGEGSGAAAESACVTLTPDTGEVSLPKNLDTYRWSSRTVDPCKVYGLDDKERFLERLLVRKECKNGFKALAIVGMTGVGKTILCQLMFNNKKVKEHFLPRIWVCLSKQPEDDEDKRKEAVIRMLMCLGVEDDIIEKAGEDQNLGLQRLMFALRLQLMGKKYLIVLDDAWNSDKCFEDLYSESTQDENSYGQLAYGLPKGHGGTVVITTRSEEIAKKMVGEENLHQLPILKDRESCWKIFKDAVEKGESKFPQELMPLRDLIVDKCAGLPLVAKMMGEIMYQKLLQNPIQNQIEQSQNQQQSSAQQSAVQ